MNRNRIPAIAMGLGYIGDDATKEAFVPTYGAPTPAAVSPVNTIASVKRTKMKPKMGVKKILPWAVAGIGAAVAAFFALKK